MQVTKEEVEGVLRRKVDESLFDEALSYAKKKQTHSYENERRPVLLSHWYLVQLTADCVVALAFQRYTMDLCDMRSNIEKERPVKDQVTPNSNYIVPQISAVNQ